MRNGTESCEFLGFSASTRYTISSWAKSAQREVRCHLSSPLIPDRLLRLTSFVLRDSFSQKHTRGSTWVSQKPSRSFVPRSWDKGGRRPGRHRTLYLGAVRLGMSRRLGRGCADGWWIYLGRGSLFYCGRARAFFGAFRCSLAATYLLPTPSGKIVPRDCF